jgi:GT2 family glycosyltransferase
LISIIICSRSNKISDSLKENIQNTIGCEYELIVIDNSKNNFSIFSAYNAGIQKSKFTYLCFVHTDVEFITQNWGNKIAEHLKLPNVGLIGLAGGKAALHVPYGWTTYIPVVNIIHSLVDQNNVRVDKQEQTLINGDKNPQSVVLLDGVFLCANRSLFEKCKFDENLGGFHGYDLDISMQAFYQGFTNYVVLDINIKHFSKGVFGIDYLKNMLNVHQKWEKELPFIVKNSQVTPEKMRSLEAKTLKRLKKRMVRSGMNLKEISPIIKKYVLQNGNQFDKLMLFSIDIQLYTIKTISKLRRKMIYQK